MLLPFIKKIYIYTPPPSLDYIIYMYLIYFHSVYLKNFNHFFIIYSSWVKTTPTVCLTQ